MSHRIKQKTKKQKINSVIIIEHPKIKMIKKFDKKIIFFYIYIYLLYIFIIIILVQNILNFFLLIILVYFV